VIRTKDSLAKQNWQGQKNIGSVIKMYIKNLFSNWLAGWIKKKEHKSELALVLSFGRIDGTTRGSGAGTRH
jgi:hypothetical protein